MINYRHSTEKSDTNELGGLAIEFQSSKERTNYPVNLSVDDYGVGFQLEVQVDGKIRASSIAEYVLEGINVILSSIESQSSDLVVNNSLLSDRDRNIIFNTWGSGQHKDHSINDVLNLLESQFNATPENTALVCSGISISYAELHGRANRLANYLCDNSLIESSEIVGIAIDRSVEMVVAILAVLKLGCAYLPIDPDYPDERVNYVIENSSVKTILTSKVALERIDTLPGRWIPIDNVNTQIDIDQKSPLIVRDIERRADRLCYVIYTSGSTGKPKGVMVDNYALSNLLISMKDRPGLSSDDTLLAITTLSFDIATLEILLPLITGSRLILTTREESASPKYLIQLLDSYDVTVIQATPSRLRLILESGWKGAKSIRIWSGGETLSGELSRGLNKLGKELWNMYGPTETTIWSTCHLVPKDSARTSELIGSPIYNTHIYVLNHRMQPVPENIVGELFIGGLGLSRGYLGRPELSDERFIEDPFSNSGNKIYRTGDLVRWLNNGDLEYIGRADDQVKIRGYRIELGEIEMTISKYTDVLQVVVVAREDGFNNQRLVAYIRSNVEDLDMSSLTSYLKSQLPDYMLPMLVQVDVFPTTPNGKVDRKNLPICQGYDTEMVGSADVSAIESKLIDIWRETIGLSTIGKRDNFFTLGGHSILALRIISRINLEYEIEVSTVDLIERQTIESLAELVDDKLFVKNNLEFVESEDMEVVEW